MKRFTKRKLTKSSLDELAERMPVLSEEQQMSYVGGGDGTSDSPYTVDEFERMCASGTWNGGYVEGWSYTLGEVIITGNIGGNNNSIYIDKAKEYEGTPYVWGGSDSNGMDCSGLVNAATDNDSGSRWTTSSGMPPGNWMEISVSSSSDEAFIGSLQVGDLLVWEGRHTAFYNGGESLYHAHGSQESGSVGETYDLKRYWLKNNGYPKVYRPN